MLKQSTQVTFIFLILALSSLFFSVIFFVRALKELFGRSNYSLFSRKMRTAVIYFAGFAAFLFIYLALRLI